MIFHSHADKTHFHKTGYALGLIESEGFWNSEEDDFDAYGQNCKFYRPHCPTIPGRDLRKEKREGLRGKEKVLAFDFCFHILLPSPFGACHISYQLEQGIQYNSLPD